VSTILDAECTPRILLVDSEKTKILHNTRNRSSIPRSPSLQPIHYTVRYIAAQSIYFHPLSLSTDDAIISDQRLKTETHTRHASLPE
jgi:hypothetical protein